MWPRISPKDRAAGSGLKAYSPSGIFSAALVIQDVTCVWTHLRIAAHRLQVRSLRHRSTGQDKQYRKKFHRQIVARKATVFERMTGYSSHIGLGKSCRPNVPYARLGRECRTPTRTARRIADP